MKATSSTLTPAKQFRVTTWEECKTKVAEIEKENATSHTKLLFRGQRCATWRLDTTLERRIPGGISVIDYYRTIFNVMPEVSTYFDAPRIPPNFDDIYNWC